jgi:nucleoside-diphosphate-sugar epimerase
VSRRALVFGLSGQLGDALRGPLLADGWNLVAVSRQTRAAEPGIEWVAGHLPDAPWLTDAFDAVLSLGPLDVFAQACAAHPPRAPRIVAVGSTGVHSKADSPDPHERALAATLAHAERTLEGAVAGRGALCLLRPTLIYGHGRDASLTPLVAFARRRGWLALPRAARGLRQPVHVDDLAAAVMACLRAPDPVDARLDLPGGETLPFSDLVARTLAKHAPGTRLLRVPTWLFRIALRIARRRLPSAVSADGFVGRLNRDQVFAAEPARERLGFAPRGFEP